MAATAGYNIGDVLQKKDAIILPPLSFKLKVSVVQPVSGCGLAILSIFSHFYLMEVMNAVDWLAGFGITVYYSILLVYMSSGLGFPGVFLVSVIWLLIKLRVGAGGEKQEAAALSIFYLPWLAFVVFILFMEYDVVEEIIYGLKPGILFGMASVISKMGFLFLERGFPKLLVPICIMISVFCSSTGFYYQTCGLKHGRAIVVSTCAAVASILTGVLAGMLALEISSSETFCCKLLIIVGVILLVGSTRLVKFLRFPSHCFNFDKNYGSRRSGTCRTREPSPSSIIQATTLNHLLSSPKEKA